jgi:hypothetical protein
MKIYDICGKEVASLMNEVVMQGSYSMTFDGTGLEEGIYVCRLLAGQYSETIRLAIAR